MLSKTVLQALLVLSAVLPTVALGQERVYFNLNNGITIGPARRADVETISRAGSVNAKNLMGGAKVIVEADDDLRVINFNRIQITDGGQERWTLARPQIRIFLPNKDRVADSKRSQTVTAISEMPQAFDFNDMGRRYYKFSDGRIVVQGITEISPSYVRVEGLAGGEGDFKWDMRLSLNSIHPATLRAILMRNADDNRSRSYLDIVELYETAKRFTEAREVLSIAIQKFPELESHRSSLKRYDQLAADQLFEASDFAKRKAGQHDFAKRILESFDYSLLSLETRLKVERQKELTAEESQELTELVKWIEEDVQQVSDTAIREEFRPIIEEIQTYLTPDLSSRFADYRRLRMSANADQRSALAIGGWLMGEGLADDSLSLVSSAAKSRELVRQYLSAKVADDQTLDLIANQEAGTARYVSRILANMPPPVDTPDSAIHTVRGIPDRTKPDEIVEMEVPGRYLLEYPLQGAMKGKTAHYIVQLPPEYNPYRKYPCVVTMHGAISTPEAQINWWCGAFDPVNQRCWGEAAKNGYIVVAPSWHIPALPNYNFTEDEHAYVLGALHDAKRRFSIDTDRLFISGHETGGTGAWDISLAHPDLWAGCIVICGTVEKYIRQIFPNTRYVPSYFVTGELAAVPTTDGAKSHRWNNERVWDALLKERVYDVLVTEYKGRGLDHFQEELPRIAEWMNSPSRVRNFAPDRFEVRTARAGDRYFWWFETEQLFVDKLVHPLLHKDGSDYKIESRVIRDSNLVDMEQVPAEQYTVNLTPDMVDMSRTIQIRFRGSVPRRVEPATDSRTMLRDVRQRADRQRPFWMRVSIPR